MYGEEENRFLFNNVLVGAKAKARFKISNNNKVSNGTHRLHDRVPLTVFISQTFPVSLDFVILYIPELEGLLHGLKTRLERQLL